MNFISALYISINYKVDKDAETFTVKEMRSGQLPTSKAFATYEIYIKCCFINTSSLLVVLLIHSPSSFRGTLHWTGALTVEDVWCHTIIVEFSTMRGNRNKRLPKKVLDELKRDSIWAKLD